MANASIYAAFERMWQQTLSKLGNKADKTYVDSQITEANKYTDDSVANLLNNSSEAVDSIFELRDAMEDNVDAIEALTTIAGSKVDKVDGKGLSTNDYTTEEKNKLAGIAAGAEVNVQSDWNATSGDAMILNKPAIPTVPTNVSAFTNDANYAKVDEIPTKVSQLENDKNYLTTHQDISGKADKADIATTAMQGTAEENTTYWKIYDFGNWGTGTWMNKGFSMLVTSRAGEMIWVSLAANDSNTSAGAIRLINRYGKIAALHYSVSESAIYATAAAWSNNICAHIISNVNGDYVPKIAKASALPSDAVAINIVEFGVDGTGTVVGDSSVPLALGGSADRPTYNGANVALQSEVPSKTETWTFTYEDGSTETKVVYVG